MNILIVDDNKNITDSLVLILNALLKRVGYDMNVTGEHDPHKAEELIKNNDYEIVVSDLNLGGYFGYMYRQYMNEGSLLYICSGEQPLDEEKVLVDEATDRFILKPLDTKEICSYIIEDIQGYDLNDDDNLKVA